MTISASEPSSVVVGDLTLFGTINPEPVTKDDKSTLFLSTGNELHYPSVNGYIKGFRAYFTVKPGSPLAAVIQRGGPVRIKDHKDAPTAVENTNAELNAEKRLENGQVVIIRNGVKYTIQGQKIQ